MDLAKEILLSFFFFFFFFFFQNNSKTHLLHEKCTRIKIIVTIQTKIGWCSIPCLHRILSQAGRNRAIVSAPQPCRLLVTPPVSLTNMATSSGSFSLRRESQMLPPMNSWTILRSAERHWKTSLSSSWSMRSCLDSQLTFQDRMAL